MKSDELKALQWWKSENERDKLLPEYNAPNLGETLLTKSNNISQ